METINALYRVIITLGASITVAAIPFWYLTRLPFSSFTILIMGMALSVGASIDYKAWLKR